MTIDSILYIYVSQILFSLHLRYAGTSGLEQFLNRPSTSTAADKNESAASQDYWIVLKAKNTALVAGK